MKLATLGLATLAAAAPAPVLEYRQDAGAAVQGLHDYAKAAGKLYFGTAVDIPGNAEGNDQYYMAQFNNTHDFGQSTPGNVMKWQFTEPEQNTFTFTNADAYVKIAQSLNQTIRCHNLIWHQEAPSWVTNGQWTNETLLAAIENRVKTTIAHFGDACYAWDVVNEALNDDGTYRNDVYYNVTGTSYITTAFRAAQEAVTANNLTVKLYYNDYNIEYAGAKSTSAQNIVKLLKSQGIQIDGVGLQAHFIVGSTPSTSTQLTNLNAFGALGVDTAITELDIRTTTPPTDSVKTQQVTDYQSTVNACLQATSCVGLTIWDFDDTYSWVPSTFSGQGYALPWYQPNGTNTPLVKKPVYDGIVSALSAGQTAGNASATTTSSSGKACAAKRH